MKAHGRRRRRPAERGARVAVCLLLACLAPACTTVVQRVGIAWLYREASHPEALTELDVPYVTRSDGAVDSPKHRLDLYWPDPGASGRDPGAGRGWPVLVFVHGGGWTRGDRAQEAGGADVFRNIGRFFASRGVGAAVISYRLQPEATWTEQVADVGRAVGFVRDRVDARGGQPDAIFLAGHSAGAHLAARFALDPAERARAGAEVCGLILVSGAAYDLADAETYTHGADRGWFEERFRAGDADWERRASVVPLVRADSPAALVLYASGEPAKLRRQSDLLVAAYREAGASVRQVVVPGEDHERIVLTLSRDDKTAGPAMLDFVRQAPCGPAPMGARTAASPRRTP
jgi:acetyl esterase/lipase